MSIQKYSFSAEILGFPDIVYLQKYEIQNFTKSFRMEIREQFCVARVTVAAPRNSFDIFNFKEFNFRLKSKHCVAPI